jgi:hypothetical protein
MSVSPISRWPDDRLDDRIGDLSRRLEQVEPTVTTVALLEQRMEQMTNALTDNTAQQKKLARKFDDFEVEPFTRKREFMTKLMLVLVGALVGGVFAVAGAVISSSGH